MRGRILSRSLPSSSDPLCRHAAIFIPIVVSLSPLDGSSLPFVFDYALRSCSVALSAGILFRFESHSQWNAESHGAEAGVHAVAKDATPVNEDGPGVVLEQATVDIAWDCCWPEPFELHCTVAGTWMIHIRFHASMPQMPEPE